MTKCKIISICATALLSVLITGCGRTDPVITAPGHETTTWTTTTETSAEINAEATTESEWGTFTGRLVCEDDIDLSGVELKVYSEKKAGGDYHGTYAFTVYPDRNGVFTFQKPSQYCAVSVNIETIPEDYGISGPQMLIFNGESEMQLKVSAVTAMDIVPIYLQVSPPTLRNAEDEVVLAVIRNKAGGVQVEPSSDVPLTLADIDARNVYYQNGYAYIGTRRYRCTVDEDMPEDSRYRKINVLGAIGEISQGEQISLLCDLMLSEGRSYEYTFYQRVLDQIDYLQAYGQGTNTPELNEKVAKVHGMQTSGPK